MGEKRWRASFSPSSTKKKNNLLSASLDQRKSPEKKKSKRVLPSLNEGKRGEKRPVSLLHCPKGDSRKTKGVALIAQEKKAETMSSISQRRRERSEEE